VGTLVRTETLVHQIGTDGRVSVKTISGLLRVRGADGTEARLTVTYRIRAADQAAAERALESGRVIVDRGPGYIDVETPERRLSTGLAWLFGGARVGADVSLEVPWGTRVRYETMNGSIEASALVGDQKYRTISGEIRMFGLGGLIEAGSLSGSVILDDGGDVRLKANSVSGAIKARARRFYVLNASTTSGSIALAGALDPTGDHRADSISGSITLTPMSGVTAELKTISGSISSEMQNRVEGGRGFWRSVVGDGAATLRVNSTSGGLRIVAPRPADSVAPAPAPADSQTAAASSGEPSGHAPVGEPSEPAFGPEETWNPEETPDYIEPEAQPDDELVVLQALERGEIGVDEAAERLERARRSGDVR
jgi:hypothetical protein